MVQAIIWCLGQIAKTLLRFAAYCTVLAAAVMGTWYLIMDLLAEAINRQDLLQKKPAIEVRWTDGKGPQAARSAQD